MTAHRKIKAIYWLPVLLIILTVSCSLPRVGSPTATPPEPTAAPTDTPRPTPTPQPLPPAVVENDPPVGSELPLNGPITLYFNQPMERASVEAAMRQQLSMSGTFTWVDDLTLVFTPDAPLEPASNYKVTLAEDIRAANGLGLLQPVSFDYQTVDYLRPVQILPEPGAGDIDPTSAVVVAFNYPVVPLGADQAGLPVAFTLEPAAEGRGEWLNTSTYIFYPQPALDSGLEYTIRLKPDLLGTDGSPLETLETWAFSTRLPRLEKIEPVTELPLRLDAKFALTFNQPMDPASVEANLSLLDPAGSPVQGAFEWNEDQSVVTFTPAQLLARQAPYTLNLDGAAQASGGKPLGESLNVLYQTVPDLSVLRTDPPPGGLLAPYSSVGFFLSTSLIYNKDYTPQVRVEPSITNLNSYWDDYEGVLRIMGDFLPQRDYTVTLSGELTDTWGDALGEDYSVSISTAVLEPTLAVPIFTGVLFQPADDPGLSVQAANIGTIPVSVGTVPLPDFFKLLDEGGYDFRRSYTPADAQTWDQTLDAPTDQVANLDLPLSPDNTPLPPGLYMLRAWVPVGDQSSTPYLIVSSNVQATLKVSATDAFVWATDLRDGAPVADAPVNIYAKDGTILASGRTDAQGVFQAAISTQQDLYSPFYAMLGQPGDDQFGMSISIWNSGMENWEFGLTTDYSPPRLRVYWYSDRSVYRPGQTVYFRGVLRQAYNGRYTLPDVGSLAISVMNDMGQSVAVLDLPVSGFGTVQGEFTIPSDARSGYYSIGVPDQYYDMLGFQVAEYRKPEINLQVDFAQDQLRVGDSLNATINARYFFDAPAGNVPLHWVLYSAPSEFFLPGYQVGPVDTSWLNYYQFSFGGDPLGEMVLEGDAETNPDGTYTLELSSDVYKPDMEARRRYTLEVTATDESGLPVSARDTAQTNPAEYYIGVQPDGWNGEAGTPLDFDIQVVDWQGQPAGPRALTAEFSKVVWVRQDHPAPVLMYYQPPTYTPEYTLVDSTEGTTNEQGQARLSFIPPEPGTYQLSVTGDGALTEVQTWVAGPGQAIWPDMPNKRVRIVPDQLSYRPGDTAQVFIPNPFGTAVPALLTVERGKVLRYQLFSLEPGGSSVSLPLSSEDAPNVYLSLTLLGKTPSDIPDFRQGFVNLDVEPVDQVLKVELVSQPQRLGPGDEVTFEIRVTDSVGTPVQGEFSLAVVDLAALALADPNSQDIVAAFYSRQPLSVRTSHSLSAYTRLFMMDVGGLGGGGGDGMIAPVVREYFPDTAFWDPAVVTDEDGLATVTLRLPDTLTTWQADVRGLTEDTRVGQATTQVVTTKNLLVRPVTPRFLVVDDHVQVAAIVQNNTPQERQVAVTLQPNGLALDDPAQATQQVTLPANGRLRVEWWGIAQDVDSVDLIFSAQTISGEPALQDSARPPLGLLPVLRYNARQAFRTAGTLDEGGERLELVSLPRSFDPTSGELSVELSPSLAASMMRALEALEHFPYECTEQTVSRFLPNLETYRVLQEFGLGTPALQARLDRTLSDGLARLQNRQNFDGGWGWWQGEESDSYMTAYVLLALNRAKQAGVTVNENVLNQGTEYLRSNIGSVAQAKETWELDRLVFEHMVLAEMGSGDPAATDALFQVRDQLNPWSQALLAITLDRLTPGSENARTLLSDLQSAALRSSTGAYWELPETGPQNMVGNLTNTAMVLYALAQQDPGSPLVADTVRFLMSNRQPDGAWESTYATAWTLMALNHVVKGTGELGGDFAYSASLNGAPLASGQAAGADQLTPATASVALDGLYPDDPNALLIQRQTGSGRLYYTAGLQVARPVDSVPPLSQGLGIERVFVSSTADCPAQDCAPIQSARAGQKVTVKLTLTVPHDAYNLVVEDYIPAGAEILNTTLKTSELGIDEGPEAEPLYDPSQPYSEGWGWWLFRDPQIYDDRISWAAGYLPAGTYQLTYTLVLFQPGEYRVLPARAWQFYFPEVQANSPGALFAIEP